MDFWGFLTGKDLIVNLTSSFIILFIETALLSYLIPAIIRRRAERSWEPMRRIVEGIIREERTGIALTTQRAFEAANKGGHIDDDLFKEFRSNFDRLANLELIQFMTPALTPELAGVVTKFASHMTVADRILRSWTDDRLAAFLRLPTLLATPIDWSNVEPGAIVIRPNDRDDHKMLDCIIQILESTSKYRVRVRVALPQPDGSFGVPEPEEKRERLVVFAEDMIKGMRARLRRPDPTADPA